MRIAIGICESKLINGTAMRNSQMLFVHKIFPAAFSVDPSMVLNECEIVYLVIEDASVHDFMVSAVFDSFLAKVLKGNMSKKNKKIVRI
ncbi:hypothetical protein K2X05_06825 [bacterium]|nr:hypothetical protein [bacterium]